MLKKIFKESVLYTFAQQVPLLANIVILPLITPFLTPEDYGMFGLLMAYVQGLSFLADLGFGVLFQNSFFKNNEGYKEDWKKYLGFQWLWKMLYGILIAFIISFVFYNELDTTVLVMTIVLISLPQMFFTLTNSVGMKFCQYTDNHKGVYTISLITGVLAVLTTFVSVYFFKLGFLGWLISQFIVSLVSFFYFSNMLYRKEKILPRLNFNIKFLKQSFKIALPIIPHSYSNYLLNTSDRVIMDLMKVPMDKIGLYNVAYSFGNYFAAFNNAVNTVVSPIYFKLFASKDSNASKLVRQITFVWMSFILVAAFILCLWLSEIFTFLYRNPDLLKAYPYAVFIIFSLAYRPMYVAAVDKNIFLENTKGILKISVVAGIGNVVLNLLLLPHFGIQGAIVATFVCYLYMGFAGYFIPSIKKNIEGAHYPLLWFLLILGLSIVSYSIVDILIWWKVLITILVLLLCVLLYFKVGKNLIQSINSIT
jgi:O-antigen/teichoic acid export membrane protein